MVELTLGIAVFTTIVTALVVLIVTLRAFLVPGGDASITVNETLHVEARLGSRLLEALNTGGIYLPSACGGRGTCGQCVVTILRGAVAPFAVESSLLSKRDLERGARLACQVIIRENLAISIPSEALGVKKWLCTVRSTRNVATLMKEIIIDLPPGERIDFRAGAYIQVACPPHRTSFTSFDVASEYRDEWDRLDLWRHEAASATRTVRAYSLANPPVENQAVTLVVRIATPPPGAPESVPAGVVSSYLFSLRSGATVDISGPYGSFCVSDSELEMVFIGGGAGIAPLRSMILDQLERVRTKRKITFWYGARNLRELFYKEEFDRLADGFENFHWHVALSEPRSTDHWDGERGFIHEVLHERYLKNHPAPAACEYYLCGPPMMAKSVLHVLDGLGVGREQVRYDDFGE